MEAPSFPSPGRAATSGALQADWLLPAAALLLGTAALAMCFAPEARAAFGVWRDSTAYSHCFLVLPIAAFLVWERAACFRHIPWRPTLTPALLAVPVAAAWFVTSRLGIMEGRQLTALAAFELLVISVIGWRMARALAAPLGYLLFLVPFGAFLTPVLQSFTAWFIDVGLGVLGISHYSDGNLIEIAEGQFFVAEACAGLRFLIASVAFGVLYALTMFHGRGRRVAFIAASIIIPVIANGIRALGIVAAGHWVGSAQAAAADHLIYGWIFFSAVTLLMVAAGLPFRQLRLAPAMGPARHPQTTASPFLPMALTTIMICMAPLAASLLAASSAAASGRAMITTPPGCMPGVTPMDFTCGATAVSVRAETFPRITPPDILLHARDGALADGAGDAEAFVPRDDGVSRAATIWVDGAVMPGGLPGRVAVAWGGLFQHGPAPVVVSVRTQGGALEARARWAAAVAAQPVFMASE